MPMVRERPRWSPHIIMEEISCWLTYSIDAYGHGELKVEFYHCNGGGRLLVNLFYRCLWPLRAEGGVLSKSWRRSAAGRLMRCPCPRRAQDGALPSSWRRSAAGRLIRSRDNGKPKMELRHRHGSRRKNPFDIFTYLFACVSCLYF